jgi:alpha-galactosidase
MKRTPRFFLLKRFSCCLTGLILLTVGPLRAQPVPGPISWRDCYARFQNDTLTLGNARIERQWVRRNHQFLSLRIRDVQNRRTWNLHNDQPDEKVAETPGPARGVTVAFELAKEKHTQAAHLAVTTETRYATYTIRRVLKLYPNVPAIDGDLYVKGTLSERSSGPGGDSLKAIEKPQTRTADPYTRAEQLVLDLHHWQYAAVRFFDATDHNNTLTERATRHAFRQASRLSGNLLTITAPDRPEGLFLLKNAPSTTSQLRYEGADFLLRNNNCQVISVGIAPAELAPDEWNRLYSCAVGVFAGGENAFRLALREFQHGKRLRNAATDDMIVLNTWGDRSRDTKVTEGFVRREIELGSQLGMTHVQIDDGWQQGKSGNSAFGGSFVGIWNNARFWNPDSVKFPDGFAPLRRLAQAKHMTLSTWFNPSNDQDFANWRHDAAALIKQYRQYGISLWKIDGLDIGTRLAETNFRRFIDTVVRATDGRARFNFDVTAGKRFGYFYGTEYGTIFLENRYTDWANYYPHWTLRNLWMLSQYMPPQQLQIEFLNAWRNPDRYPRADSLAPSRYPFSYLFAVTMVGQPLAWFEAQQLPPEAFSISPLIAQYKAIWHSLHDGYIMPIGNEPSGYTWTGFQSIGKNEGYFIVFRESSPQADYRMDTYLPPHCAVRLTPLFSEHPAARQASTDAEGRLAFRLPAARSFAAFRYEILR